MNKISLKGRVAPPSWWSDTINAEYVSSELSKITGDVEITINTFGGSVFEGIEIYNLIRNYDLNKGTVTMIAGAKCMSIGTNFLFAGSKRKAFKNSTIMCHKASSWANGNSDDMLLQSNILDGMDDIISEEYLKAMPDKTQEEIKAMMRHEMWFIGRKQLLESGFIDEIIEDDAPFEPIANPQDAYKAFNSEFMAEAVKHYGEVNFDNAMTTLKACGGNCNLTNETKVVENPTVNGKQVFNDSKGETSMTEEQIAELQANYAKSQATIEALNATVGENKTAMAEKEAEITALKETHKNELTAHKKVFGTVLASGKHFNLDQETLQANLEKATQELTANANYTDGFVAHTVNTLVLANIETDGAFVAGGGNDPQGDTETEGADAIANWKKNKQGAN